MPVVFPDITPTGMDFTPPEYPVGEDVSLSGVSVLRRYGNRPSNARLSVEFSNIHDSVGAAIVSAHGKCKGTDSVVLQESFFHGASEDLKYFLDATAYKGLSWHFVQGSPPRLSRVPGGSSLCSVTVELIARLSYS